MNKVNFNTFRDLSVSDELMEKALSIPKNIPSASPVPSRGQFRYLIAAAGMVLVFALSLFLLLRFGNKNTVPTAPSPVSQHSIIPTEKNKIETESTEENSSVSPTKTPAESNTEISTDSEGHTVISTVTEVVSVSGDGHAEPSETTAPARTPDRSSETPTQRPTSAAHTEEPQPSEPVFVEETTGDDPGPAAPELIMSDTLTVLTDIPDEILRKNDRIYCRIYDEYGTLLGDDDLFSSQHRADINRNKHYAVYDASEKRIELPEAGGLYTYVFYTEDGKDFLSGQIYILYD